MKYVKKNVEKKSDPLVKKFTEVDGLRPDLIDIPEEFKDLSIESLEKDVAEGGYGRKLSGSRGRGKIIRNRSSKCLMGYDAWRVSDRKHLKMDGRHFNVAKLWIPPAVLRRAFGDPLPTEIFYDGTG